MTRRRRFTEREVLAVLLHQGVVIPCFRCRVPFTFATVLLAEREHIHEVALGGPDTPEGARYSHGPCHAVVTNGTPATTAGSSRHRIAKTKGSRAEKFAVKKLALDKARPQKTTFGRRKP